MQLEGYGTQLQSIVLARFGNRVDVAGRNRSSRRRQPVNQQQPANGDFRLPPSDELPDVAQSVLVVFALGLLLLELLLGLTRMRQFP